MTKIAPLSGFGSNKQLWLKGSNWLPVQLQKIRVLLCHFPSAGAAKIYSVLASALGAALDFGLLGFVANFLAWPAALL